MIVNTERTQRFVIENKNLSYANIKFVTTSASTMIWPIPIIKIKPQTFRFTPQQNQCVR